MSIAPRPFLFIVALSLCACGPLVEPGPTDGGAGDAGALGGGMDAGVDLTGAWTLRLAMAPRSPGRTLGSAVAAEVPVRLERSGSKLNVVATLTAGTAASTVPPYFQEGTAGLSLPTQQFSVRSALALKLEVSPGSSTNITTDSSYLIRTLANAQGTIGVGQVAFDAIPADTSEAVGPVPPTAVSADPAVYFLTVSLRR